MRFFFLKGLNPGNIYAEFISVYGIDALVLQTLYKWHKRFAQGRTELFDDPQSGRPLQNDLAEAIRIMLQECPFTSYKRLYARLKLPRVTCLYILHKVLLLKEFNLRWVLHTLDSNSKAERIVLSSELLEVLTSKRQNDF
jgi:hypothetical protein